MIETRCGKIKGVDMGDYMLYRGIPYAKPPVGELRWREPQPFSWEGIWQADDFRSRCMQEDTPDPLYTKEFFSDEAYRRRMDEDCLYLHIWTPKGMEGGSCPVAFWIHGGAFLSGYASEMEFDGAEYCRRGVILVSVEYRCNLFGFLAHPWLSGENPQHSSGNYGMLDQIAALRWVYDNIAAFGGDPHNITVFGQSAGAMSVQTLVSSSLTEGLIAGAILQSGGSYGGGIHRDLPLKEAESYGLVLSDILKAGSLEEMRQKPAEEIMKAMRPLFGAVMPKAKGLFLTPVIDGYVLKDGYYALIDQGKIRDIPYLIGCTKHDILVEKDQYDKPEEQPLYNGSMAFCHKLEALGRKPAYMYYFTRELPGDQNGAFHSSELWYMFGTLKRCWRPWEQADYTLSGRMLDYWTNFMKYGDPNGEGLTHWKECTKRSAYVQELNI